MEIRSNALFSMTFGMARGLPTSEQEVKQMILRLTMATILVAGACLAIDPPYGGTGNGQGQRSGQQQKQAKGKRTGPQDGSGPIHTPGTGGGTGAGNRGGNRGGGRR